MRGFFSPKMKMGCEYDFVDSRRFTVNLTVVGGVE